ncbi:MAG: serine hydrolase domain-containing protein [Reyranellaceae bacterium]
MPQTETIDQPLPQGRLQGFCVPEFKPVLEAFAANFSEREETGASVCLTVDGRTVVDLWGGMADPATQRPWTRDTVSIVFSCTKGATAICAHVLKSRGLLAYDDPVTRFWPEFARHGKGDTTVRMFLDHSSAVAALRAPLKKDGAYDWDYMIERLQDEEPFWEPGTRNGYHGLTFGWTVGEIVRRVSGKSLGAFFRDEVAGPLGLDFWIGLPEEHEPRVAPMIRHVWPTDVALPPFLDAVVNDKTSLPHLFLMNTGGFMPGGANTRAGHAAEIGAANGISNARGLAGLYAPLANGGDKMVDGETLDEMGRVSMATHFDATLCIPTRFALGFMKSMDNRKRSVGATLMPGTDSAILGDAAFGHVGAGGSIGFADPACRMSFGYSMNRMGAGLLLNPRGQSLVDAAYRCLGYRDCDSGVWRR